MKNTQSLFGQYLSALRIAHDISCQHLAQKADISTAYLSQIEHGVRLNPDPKLLLKIAKILDLSSNEAIALFDLYSEATGQLTPDITEYLTGNQAALQALGQARDANVTAEDWERFIGQLKK